MWPPRLVGRAAAAALDPTGPAHHQPSKKPAVAVGCCRGLKAMLWAGDALGGLEGVGADDGRHGNLDPFLSGPGYLPARCGPVGRAEGTFLWRYQ